MSDWKSTLSRNLKAFVDSPVTNLVKGIALLFIGLSDASHTLVDDVVHRHLRVGHGFIIIGFFSVLGAIPHILDGLEANERFLESRRQKKAQQGGGADRP